MSMAELDSTKPPPIRTEEESSNIDVVEQLKIKYERELQEEKSSRDAALSSVEERYASALLVLAEEKENAMTTLS